MNPIKKKKQEFIEIKYNTRKEGYFDKRITVYSNAQNAEIILRIKGRILKKKQKYQTAPLRKQTIISTKQ